MKVSSWSAQRKVSWPAVDDAPVGALAAVVRQPDEVRRGVGVLLERLEADGELTERRVAALDLGRSTATGVDMVLALGMVSSSVGVR